MSKKFTDAARILGNEESRLRREAKDAHETSRHYHAKAEALEARVSHIREAIDLLTKNEEPEQ